MQPNQVWIEEISFMIRNFILRKGNQCRIHTK